MKRWMYYLFQWTWGLLANIFGVIGFIICRICNRPAGMWRNAFYVTLPWNFGGLSLGMFIFCGQNNLSVRSHEYGHSIQNMQWGPLFLVVIGLPSAIRYWYRAWYMKYRYPIIRRSLPDYDSIWFESDATTKGIQTNHNTFSWL